MPTMKQGGDACLLVVVQPLIEAIGITWLQQSMKGHPMGATALSHLEQGCRPFPCIGMGMMSHGFL
jgi:hypothetical protein